MGFTGVDDESIRIRLYRHVKLMDEELELT